MALVLAGPYKQCRQNTPRTCQTLYLGDRTAYHNSVQDLLQWRATWQSFERMGRLKTHEGKTQIWARAQQAFRKLSEAGLNPSLSLTALGVSLGDNLQMSEKEQQRRKMCEQRALRIGLLPAQLKQHLTATLVSPVLSRGQGLSGKWPTHRDLKTPSRDGLGNELWTAQLWL